MSNREHAHELIDRLPDTQLSALIGLLETIVEPVVSYTLSNAPLDDEPFTEEDRQAVAEAVAWLEHNEPIPHEQALAEFGLSIADWENMGEEPLPGETSRRNG
ncbi:MAG: hypothetical protein WBW33_02710 [Bryobacteraceae bacterium]